MRNIDVDRNDTVAAGVAGILFLAALPPSAPAQDGCSKPQQLDSCPPLMAQSLTQTFIQNRLNRGGALSPEARIDSRLDGRSWNPDANGAAPVTLNPGENTTQFGTSLSQWGSWLSKSDAEKIDEAKPLLQEGAHLPAPVRFYNRQMDVWTQSRVTTLKGAQGDSHGQAYTGSVGADYKLMPGLLFGGMVQLDSAEQDAAIPGGSASGEGYMAGPYMAMKLAPTITLDAKAAWGQAQDEIRVGSSSDRLDTTRRQASARLKGDWSWSKWHLSPSATLESVAENADSPIGQTRATAGTERVSVGPRLSRPVDLGGKTKLEPFVQMNRSVDLDTPAALLGSSADGSVSAHSTYGAGLSLTQTDEYRFEATANVDDPGNGAEKDVRGGVNLTIPLN